MAEWHVTKDPVNMAGFVGSNLIRGDVRVFHLEDLEFGTTHKSWVFGHLKSSHVATFLRP
jgi:hypothetical protein